MSSQNQLPNLDKIFRDDDEPDFAPSGGSNLAAIFGLQQNLPDSRSLKQTAPVKDTQYNVQQTASSSKTEVLIAKAVHAFQLKNGEYVSVGKLGIALTGNATSKVYEILLYKTKQQYISVAKITSDFVFTVQANNYANYYSTVKSFADNNWSVLFDSNDSSVRFAIEVGLARYFVTREKGENVIYQDLQPGDNDTVVKEGNNVHIKYFVGTEITQPFKNDSSLVMSQTMTVEISPDNNWERTLLGCSKGLKRILFLPPGKQISLGPGFPKERYIMLIIEIIDVRMSEETPSTAKTWKEERAAIISRMAKMGQPILPKMPLPSTTDSEDTEDDIPHKSPRYSKKNEHSEGSLQKKGSEGSLQKKNSSHDSLQERKVIQKITETRTEMSSANSNIYQPLIAPLSTQQMWTSPYLATVNRTIPTAVDPLNMLLSENRITNAEIRMGMSKISDNVQKLLDKFHALELQNATSPTASDKTTLDASLKMLLALNASQMNARENELPKSTDAPDGSLRESQSRLSVLENELKQLKEEKESVLQVNADLNKKLRELEANLSKANDELKETKETLQVALNTMGRYKEENIDLQNKLYKYNRDHQADEKRSDIERKNKEIKQIMNKTYHALSEKFTNQSRSELPLDYVKSTIAKTIKHITLQVLHEDSDDENKETEEYKDVHSTVGESNGNQQAEERTERSRVSNASGDISTKCIPSSVNTIAPIYENEPPPVSFEGIDEVDSE